MKYTIEIEDEATVSNESLRKLLKIFLDSCANDGLSLNNKVAIINSDQEVRVELSSDQFINKFDIIKENLEKIIINRIENKYTLFINNNEEYIILFLLNTKTMEKYTIGLEKEEVLYLLSVICELEDEKFDKVYLIIDELNSAINIFIGHPGFNRLVYTSSKSEKYISKLQSCDPSELDNVGTLIIRGISKLKEIEKGLINNIKIIK